MITKIYKNTGKADLVVPGIGEILAGDQVSITSEFQPPVNLVNFPGLVDITNGDPQAKSSEPTQVTDPEVN